MRKKIVILILVISGFILLSLLFLGIPGRNFGYEKDFRISDTSAVTRIEIISGDTLILTRHGADWILNGESPASKIAVNNLLFIFHRLGIKGIQTSKEAINEEVIAVKVLGGRKKYQLRFYEIDGKSFIQKKAGGNLYTIEIIGFPNIKPAEVISHDPDHWRDKTMLNLQSGEIKEISIFHPSNPEKDFMIRVVNGKPGLFEGNGQKELPENILDREKLDFYMSYFTNVFYDYWLDSEVQPGRLPTWIINVADTTGRNYILEVFPMESSSGTDMFRALVKYNDQAGLNVTRFMVLDLLLQDKEHFLLK
jgi:hypothetical protein